MRTFVLGTRGSHLALAQSRMVAEALRAAHADLVVEEKIIVTKGDERLDLSLQSTGPLDKGLFTKELENALAAREIDLAVHSLKDLPTSLPAGFALGAILPREDPADVLLTKEPVLDWANRPPGVVATSSPRRARQFRQLAPECVLREIRGNVPTRLRKLRDQPELDGLILALAGLKRLGLAEADGTWLPGTGLASDDPRREFAGLFLHALPSFLAAPGQGAVAVEIRADDTALQEALQALHCPATAACVAAERALLRRLGGGCHMALGALARPMDGQQLHLRAVYFGEPGADEQPPLHGEITGPADQPDQLAEALVAAWTEAL